MADQYLLGELSETLQKAFEVHFIVCSACCQELKEREKLLEFIKREGESFFAEYLKMRGTDFHILLAFYLVVA